ncbi:MobV family relaxase, partial [Klebsiella pneumoniae]
MSYSILRVAKVKQAANTTGIQKHVQRENNNYNNKDIDHERTHLNVDLIHGQEKQNYNELIEKRIEEGYTGKRKIRSDAIRHIDGIITSDNMFFENMDQDQVKKYFRDSLEFLKDEYGKENVVYATIHMDESTPHMHFGVVPLTEDGRLSAKDVIGNKSALTKLQDRFNEFINDKGYQLERGEPKEVTKKKHQDMDRFKQETKYHEKVFLEVQQKVEKQEERLDELTATLEPKAVKFKRQEVKTEVKDKLFGKSEVIKKKTGNLVLTPTQYKKMNEQVTAAVAIQKDYNRLKNTDLAKENQQLRKDLKREDERYEDLTEEYTNLYLENEKLSKENSLLKSHISVLEKNLRVLYKNTKKIFKDKFK